MFFRPESATDSNMRDWAAAFAIGHSKGRATSGHFGTYPGHFGTQPKTLRRQTLSESVWRRNGPIQMVIVLARFFFQGINLGTV